ncbi:MAG: hypothetical protein IKC86_01620 [Prevotella sp.]|nr:hypothetical protein [Prevotella sp.]
MLPAVAQDMSIVGFAKQKHSPLSSIKIKKDKKQATLLLTTDKKGFKFKADGQTDVVAEEGDGILTLKVPHKTQFLTITHPDYGQYTWRVPGKSLRKRSAIMPICRPTVRTKNTSYRSSGWCLWCHRLRP